MANGIFIAHSSALAFVMIEGFLCAFRSGKYPAAVSLVWVSSVLLTVALGIANLELVRCHGIIAMYSRKPDPEIHELINALPEGSHILAALMFAWIPGFAAAGIGVRAKKFLDARRGGIQTMPPQ